METRFLKGCLPYVLAILFCLVGGCALPHATPYQSYGWSGGYSESRVDEKTYEVKFAGNMYSKSEQEQYYTLVRAAEIAMQNRKPYFEILNQKFGLHRQKMTIRIFADPATRRQDARLILTQANRKGFPLEPATLTQLSAQKADETALVAAKRKQSKELEASRERMRPSEQDLKPLSGLYARRNEEPPKETSPQRIGLRWAVIIGISAYQDTRIPSLRYSAADAKALYEWLTSPQGGRYSPTRVKLLLNENAKGTDMREALFEWLGQALMEDLVIIYFAGHGSPQSPDLAENLFLLPYDAQYDRVATTGFPMWDIETALRRFVKARKVIVIADACHAGGIGRSFDIARRSNRGIHVNPISSGLENLSKIGDGVCVISASGEKQLSRESQDWGGGHGVFTHFLLNGLKGEADYNNDEQVTLGELIPYLSEQVRRSTRSAQTPIVAGKFDPALCIAKR